MNIPYIRNFPTDTNTLIFTTNCIQLEDQFIYVRDDALHHEELINCIELQTDLRNCPNGVYLYILCSIDNNQYFYFTKPRTLYEFGTKHMHMVNRIKPDRIHFAGEIYKTDELRYNFASGTYMDKSILFKSNEDFMTHFLSSQVSIPVVYDRHVYEGNRLIIPTLLTPERITFTQDDIEHFVAHGARIYYFRTKEECSEFQERVNVYERELNEYYTKREMYREKIKKYNKKNTLFKKIFKPVREPIRPVFPS